MKLTTKRLALLREMEAIIGDECYNGNIQNWGPNGAFYGTGREFRYPTNIQRWRRRNGQATWLI